jgi:type 1 fimbriae regulatory protein FimB/type 1 fimbriae regulatory protein FimE
MKPTLKLVTPATQKRTVTPKRAKNSDLRTREYLTEQEIEDPDACSPAEPARGPGQHHDPNRLPTRASELVGLRWKQVVYCRAVLHVRRVKAGTLACIR